MQIVLSVLCKWLSYVLLLELSISQYIANITHLILILIFTSQYFIWFMLYCFVYYCNSITAKKSLLWMEIKYYLILSNILTVTTDINYHSKSSHGKPRSKTSCDQWIVIMHTCDRGNFVSSTKQPKALPQNWAHQLSMLNVTMTKGHSSVMCALFCPTIPGLLVPLVIFCCVLHGPESCKLHAQLPHGQWHSVRLYMSGSASHGWGSGGDSRRRPATATAAAREGSVARGMAKTWGWVAVVDVSETAPSVDKPQNCLQQSKSIVFSQPRRRWLNAMLLSPLLLYIADNPRRDSNSLPSICWPDSLPTELWRHIIWIKQYPDRSRIDTVLHIERLTYVLEEDRQRQMGTV